MFKLLLEEQEKNIKEEEFKIKDELTANDPSFDTVYSTLQYVIQQVSDSYFCICFQ